MPIVNFWNIETVADFKDMGTGVVSCELIDEDTAEALNEYMVESVVDAINMA